MESPHPRPKRGSIAGGEQVTLGPLVTERGAMLITFLVILVAATLLVATPRMVAQVADESLIAEFDDAPAVDRNLELVGSGRVGPSPVGPFSRVEALGDRFRSENFTPLLSEVFAESSFVVDTPELVLASQFGLEPELYEWAFSDWESPPTYGVYLTLRYLEGTSERVSLLEGREPVPRGIEEVWIGDGCPEDPGEIPPGTPSPILDENGEVICGRLEFQVVEATFGRETLVTLGVGIGARMVVAQFPLLVVEVVGIVEMNDATDDFWMGEPWIERPSLNLVFTPSGLEIEDAFVTGLFSPSVYSQLLEITAEDFTYRFRQFMDIARVTPDVAVGLSSDLRSMQLTRFLPPFETFRLNTALPQLIDVYFLQMGRVVAALSTSVFGVGVAALAIVGMLAYLIESRQRTPMTLLRNRGASRGQLTVSQIFRGLLIAIPAVLVAYLIGLLLTPYDSGLSRALGLGMVIGVSLTFVAAGYPGTHADLGAIQRTAGSTAARPSMKRRVAELMVVILALVSLFIVLRRGPSPNQIDLLLALVPSLLAVAAGLVGFRLLAVPIGAAAWISTRFKGAAGFVGFRRVRQQSSQSKTPMLVIVVTITIVVFTFMVRASIHQADEASSYQEVGADFLITAAVSGNRLPSDLDMSEVDGVGASAFAFHVPATRACMTDRTLCDFLDVLFIDGPRYHPVIVDTLGDAALPAFVRSPQPRPGLGTEEDPIPAVVSSSWQASGQPSPGRVFSLRVGGVTAWYVISEVRDRFPGLSPARPFVVVESTLAVASGANAIDNANRLYLRAGAGASNQIVDAAATWRVNVDSRHDLYRELRSDLIARTVDLGLVASLIVLVILAALAVVGLVVFSEVPRLRDLGFLRTLGLSRPEERTVTAIEVVSTVSAAAAAGALVGFVSVVVLRAPIGLETVPGGMLGTVVLVTIASTGAALIALATLGRSGERRDLTTILKVGDE